jgi:hypothetical protein
MAKTIESNKTQINSPPLDIFKFVGNFNNFGDLMPEQVENFKSTEDTCHFDIKGLASLGMRITERIPYNRIEIVGDGKIPFDFSISCFINQISSNSSEVQLVAKANLNPFLGMVALGPLTNFVNLLMEKLKVLMEGPKA